MCEQSCACLACRVVGQDECAVRGGLLDSAGGGYCFPGTIEPRRTVGVSTPNPLKTSFLQETLDDGGAGRPAGHASASSGGPMIQTRGADWICWMSASGAAVQRSRLEIVTLTGKPTRCSARSAAS